MKFVSLLTSGFKHFFQLIESVDRTATLHVHVEAHCSSSGGGSPVSCTGPVLSENKLVGAWLC